ncbi:MAG: hypothetical protein K2I81_03890 [Alphaproteobacteria bacterium]|nr:hypothetical protein [Alphaproteobacteria bacterium]
MLLKKIFSKIMICAIGVILVMPGAMAAGNVPGSAGDIGDDGVWATENNLQAFSSDLSQDIEFFQSEFQNQLVADYVPVEAKIGLAFMNAMTLIGRVLDSSLVRFATIFIAIAFLFWMGFEAYQMIIGQADVKKSIEGIVKKGFTIAIWVFVIQYGPAQTFMLVAGPIITVGTYMSDMILNAVTTTAGATLPDTCATIREYAAAHISPDAIIDANAAADLMCVPTRLSGFFYTAVAAGWKWMLAGIGHSMFTFLIGVVFIVIFLINIWKFALMALGVIADLFLTIFMLPFTAIAETVGKTSYKGIAGTIFNGFLGLFKTENLTTQINRFINAAIYFVSLSIVVAICTAILSGVVDADLAAQVPSIDNDGFMITLLIGCLVAYLADKALQLAKDLGGSVDDSLGQQFGKDITKLAKNIQSQAQKYWKLYKDSKK